MPIEYGFYLMRPSGLCLFGSAIMCVTIVAMGKAHGIAALSFSPTILAGCVALIGSPSLVFNAGIQLLILKLLGKHATFKTLGLAFACSVPVSLWAMQRIQLENVTREGNGIFGLAYQRTLKSPLYRTLYLVHYAPLIVAAPKLCLGLLCDLSSGLAHLNAMKLVFWWIQSLNSRDEVHPPSSHMLIAITAAEVLSSIMIESRILTIAARIFHEEDNALELDEEKVRSHARAKCAVPSHRSHT